MITSPQLPTEDIQEALKRANVKNCDEYKHKYFNSDKQNTHIMRALAYQMAFCTKQDLGLALKHHLIAIEGQSFLPLAAVHLALIYKFGPADLSNEEKAFFYARQAAIMTSVVPEKEIRRNLIEQNLGGQPTPAFLEEQIEWLEGLLSLSYDERKDPVKVLQTQGYISTNYIWDQNSTSEEHESVRHEIIYNSNF
ncbi:MAG: hypothetical protein KTR28_09505 [Micavibrio sp.]|nr:hypothetical protein [Micavibrio sp.]